jgi:hypothetical protein
MTTTIKILITLIVLFDLIGLILWINNPELTHMEVLLMMIGVE